MSELDYEYKIEDALLVTDEYQRRWWQWDDGHRIPYSVSQPPMKRKKTGVADGADQSEFVRGLYK